MANTISVAPDGNGQIFPARLARCYDRVSHGDFPDWIDAINGLPDISPSAVNLDTDTISIGTASDCSASERETMRRQLQRLLPWRKGPFNLFGLEIDAEWRSDMKWRRLQDKIAPLSGRTILDVGCGNGYYGWRMLGAGAKRVVGTDPTLRYVMQQRAVAKYLPGASFDILPFTLETLAAGTTGSGAAQAGSDPAASLLPADGFDTVFSMGVIYHRRDPAGHISDLLRFLRPGGELVLESLIIDDKHGEVLHPRGRYARMRNIWAIPSIATLKNWLSDAGLTAIQVADVSITTPTEQRVTEWTFEQSLSDFLDPQDPSLTVEGYPAPKRAILTGKSSRHL